ncbi:hypothetical protein RHMOL_Rhmol05G0037100 [Rhododendron molle]|uniref:Uncharacterized protein n=1 Tax=Rhododendron molle TaxID=49168 RepID=A0ACC0NLM3_RHOML|nr:hypothetical protein RHMOL_Rhmol05G0037100 [Rhododendron molle]
MSEISLYPRIIRVFDYLTNASVYVMGYKASIKSNKGNELPPPQPQLSEFQGLETRHGCGEENREKNHGREKNHIAFYPTPHQNILVSGVVWNTK